MNCIAVYDHLTGKRLAFLQNAFNIGYTLSVNGLHTARFSMPATDEKNRYCQPLNYVEIFDGEKRVELFRIVPYTFSRTGIQSDYTYDCEHVLATLMDDVLFGWHEVGNIGTYTPQALRYVLDRQQTPRWQLAECDFKHQYLYGWENENLLSALFSVANPFPEQYRWECDTRSSPWTVSLKKWDASIKGEIRYRKNLTGIEKHVDAANLATRLYCLGYGEGDNQLNLGTVPYLEADTVNKYGVVSKIWVDRRYQDRQSLRDAGQAMLERLKEPFVSYDITSVDLYDLRDIRAGDTVRVIDDEDGIRFSAPVISLSKSDLTGDNAGIKVTIANKPQDVAATVADLSDRQRIADLYAQGATNIDSHDFADNCDADNPATMRFYIPPQAVRINLVRFTYAILPFRSYSKGVASSEQQSSTSSSGGGSTETSEAAGSASVTSGSSSSSTTDGGGGGTTNNSAATSSVQTHTTGPVGSKFESHYHNFGFALITHNHRMSAHSHGMQHTHTVKVPSHRHDVEIPGHKHRFTIPSHSHETLYGIFTGGQAGSVRIVVDGTEVPEAIAPNQDFDITGYLSTDGGGKITRSAWHEIEIIPDRLTRIEASLITQLFINSRGGGDY